MQLETQRLLLRQFRVSDIDDYYEYASMEKVGPMAGWIPYSNKEDAMQRLSIEIMKPHQFAIELKKEHKVIGSIEIMDVKKDRYKNIKIEENSKELGSIISEKYWGNGYMPEAIIAALKFCFNVLHVSVVYAGYLEKNTQSLRLKEKCGFKIVGKVPNYRKWIDGMTSDLIVVNITKEEFETMISHS